MSDGVLLRGARTDDAPALSALMRTMWHDTYDRILGCEKVEETTRRWHAPDRLRREIEPGGDALVLVAEDDQGRLIGTAMARMDAGEEGVLILHRLYVLPGRQRMGLGTQFLDAVLAAFPGAGRVRLEAAVENGKAIDFYGKHGFERVAPPEPWEGDERLCEVVMEKRFGP